MDQLDGARVLVVDASALARAQMARQLDDAGAEVTAVASAADALSALSAARYDVLICDLRLPGTEGYALLRAVRAAGANRDIAAIAITAHADEESRRKALAAGFDDFIPKLVSALLVPSVARLRTVVARSWRQQRKAGS